MGFLGNLHSLTTGLLGSLLRLGPEFVTDAARLKDLQTWTIMFGVFIRCNIRGNLSASLEISSLKTKQKPGLALLPPHKMLII
jgi:hypothetical protein